MDLEFNVEGYNTIFWDPELIQRHRKSITTLKTLALLDGNLASSAREKLEESILLQKFASYFLKKFCLDFFEDDPQSVLFTPHGGLNCIFKGVRVLDEGKKREEYLDGYVPHILFKVTGNKVVVKSYLEQSGLYKLDLFGNILYRMPRGDGVQSPKVRVCDRGQNRRIDIASVYNSRVVLDTLCAIYDFMGKTRFDELAENMSGTPSIRKRRDLEEGLRMFTPVGFLRPRSV